MRLFSALGLVVVFILFSLMMPRVFSDIEVTLHQLFSAIQDALALVQHFLAMIPSNT